MTEETRPDERRTTRRALLAASLGGVGAWVAGAIGRVAPVAAADGDVVNVGDNLTGTKTTVFNVGTASYSALWGNSTAGSGTGVGVRYYTGFGPARLDVGFPLNKRAGDAPFGIYVSIGQAF